MNVSAGEALRAAVQQRLMGVLEEVLGLIQTTVDQYESQLNQSRVREDEESERLRGARALLLLRTEATEKPGEEEKEQNETSFPTIVKEEEPDPWSISETRTLCSDPASGPKNAPPTPPTTSQPGPHDQSHGNPTSNHKTESEDSDEDEECPICRQLVQHQKEELTESAVSSSETTVHNTRCNNEDAQPPNQQDKVQSQELENMQVKSEEEDQECSSCSKKSLDQERQEEGEHFARRLATNQDMETSECGKTSSEMKDETTESEKVISSSFDNDFKAATEPSAKEGPRENGGNDLDAQKSSPLLNSTEEERSLNEESEKSASLDPKSSDSSDGANKSLRSFSEQERKNDEEQARKGFKRTVTNQDTETSSKCEKTSSEMKEDTTESEKVVCSSLDNDFKAATDDSTKEGSRENGSNNLDMQKSRPFLNSAEEERSLNGESEKSTSLHPKSRESFNGADKSLENFRDQERKKDERQARTGLKRTATDLDEEMASKCRKTSPEMQEELEKVVGSSFAKDLGDAMEQENVNEKTSGLEAQNSSPLSNSAKEELSRSERNEKSTNTDLKTHENMLVDEKNANTQDQEHSLTQKLVKNLPTVRIVPLKFVDKPAQNEVQLTKASNVKPASSSLRILKKNQNGGQQNVVQNDENSQNSTGVKLLDKSTSVAARISKAEKATSSPKNVSRTEKDRQKSSDLSFSAQQKRKAKTKARTELQTFAKKTSESASDVNNSNDKTHNSSDSGKSKDIPTINTSKTKTLTAVKPSLVSEEQRTKSVKVSSNGKTNGPLESAGKSTEDTRNSNDKNALKMSEARVNQASASSKTKKKRTRAKGKGGHECPQCGTVFALKGNLLKHQVVHREERPFSCSLCDATFKRKLNLKAHMSTHSEEKEFECPVCQRKYTRKSNLAEHMRCHSEQKPFGCTLCSCRFTCRSNLRRHVLSHSGLRPFQCEVCGKNFGRKSVLSEHMASHSREQPFICEVCGSKFARKANLLKHMRLHDGTRRHKCPECGAAFSQKVHLNQHMFQHTGEKPFRCPVCGKGFTRKAYVQQHREMYCLGPDHSQDHAPRQTRRSAHDDVHKQSIEAEIQEGQNCSQTV